MHAIYRNWVALLLTFLGGLLFARTYQHTLYGWLLFTIDMGRFFYLAGVDSLPVLFRF